MAQCLHSITAMIYIFHTLTLLHSILESIHPPSYRSRQLVAAKEEQLSSISEEKRVKRRERLEQHRLEGGIQII